MGAISDKISELENLIENENELQSYYENLIQEHNRQLEQSQNNQSELHDEIEDTYFWEWSKRETLKLRLIDNEEIEHGLSNEIETFQALRQDSINRLTYFQNDLAQTLQLLEDVGEDPDENGEVSLDDDTIQRLDALFSEDD